MPKTLQADQQKKQVKQAPNHSSRSRELRNITEQRNFKEPATFDSLQRTSQALVTTENPPHSSRHIGPVTLEPLQRTCHSRVTSSNSHAHAARTGH